MSGPVYPGFRGTDETADRIADSNYNPFTPNGPEFVAQTAVNARTALTSTGTVMTDMEGNAIRVGSREVSQRGAKGIVWSSEGYNLGGATIAALTGAQKLATGTQATNAGSGVILDFSPYRNLSLIVNLVSFTAGTSPSIQFELDMQDDTGTPVSITLWKPTALTSAAASFVSLGPGVAWPQAAAADNTAPTGFAAITVPSGWTYDFFPMTFLPQGQFKWTVTGAPTAIAWSAWLYGSN